MTLNVIREEFEAFGNVDSVVRLFDRAQEFQNLTLFGTYNNFNYGRLGLTVLLLTSFVNGGGVVNNNC